MPNARQQGGSGSESGGSIYPGVDTGILVLILILFVPYLNGVRIIAEHERGVVFRFGRYLRVADPGFHWIVAGVDRLVRIELTAMVPEWRSLTREQVEARLRQLAEDGKIRASQ